MSRERLESLVDLWRERRIDRRELMTRAAALGVSATAVAGLTGTSRAAAQGETEIPGVLQIGRESEVNPLWNPLKGSTGTQIQVFDLNWARLLKSNDQLELIPDLAESYTVSDDATQFTFVLREGLTWSDGEPLTIDDVIFTYKLGMTQAAAARQWGKLQLVKGALAFYEGTATEVEGLERVDDRTVRFTLDAPNVAFLYATAFSNSLMWILPEHILADADPATLDTNPYIQNPTVGCGAFTFVEYVADQYVEFAANPSYHFGTPKIGQVFIRLAAPPTQLAQFESGELHLMPRMAPKDADRLTTSDVVSIMPAPGVGVFQIAINNERFPDKRFRQALMYAVDRQTLLDVVLLGQGELVHSTIIGPEWAEFDDLNPYAYDPEMARTLLAEVGWDGSQTIELTWSQGFVNIELAAPVFQQQLGEVGVTVELAPLESAAYLKKVVEEPDMDMAWFGGGSYRLDPDVSSPYYLCSTWTPAGANTTHYCNEALDELFIAGRATPDTTQRAEIYHQAAQILNEDVPTFFWWSDNIVWGVNKQLTGVKPGPNQYIWWNIWEWALAE